MPETRVIPDAKRLIEYFERGLEGRAPDDGPVHAMVGEENVAISFHGFDPDQTYGRALVPGVAGKNAFRIDVIDGEACGIVPRLGWKTSDFGPKRTIIGWSDEDRTTYLLRIEQGVAVADWRARRAYVWLPSQACVPWYEKAAPFRWLFDGMAERSGLAMVHAASIAADGRGMLIAGRGGAGKSTLALACLGSGMDYLGDDYCLVDSTGPECFAVYTSAKWKSDAAIVPDWLAGIAPDAVEAGEGKTIVLLADVTPERLARQVTLAAIVVPVLDPGPDARLELIAGRDALLHILPNTLIQSDAGGKRIVETVGKLVRSVPAWRLHMPRDLERSVAAVRALLEGGK